MPSLGCTGQWKSVWAAPMNDTDLKSLYTIYDYLALPAEVILMLAHWCAAEAERKLGPGRRPPDDGNQKGRLPLEAYGAGHGGGR